MKATTRDEFIKKARNKHGDKYSYDKVDYKHNKTKVIITCPQHGDFEMMPANHTNSGQGCPECAREGRMLTWESFVSKARNLHSNKFFYHPPTGKFNTKSSVDMVCSLHGAFSQTASSHLAGTGCPLCAKENARAVKHEKLSYGKAGFVTRAHAVHGNRYSYDKVVYNTTMTKVEIICREHGSFWQIPNNHLSGSICPKCANEKRLVNLVANHVTKKSAAVVEDFKKVHGDRYDYSKVIYSKANKSVEIVCSKHGSFFQTPSNHLNGRGCPTCGVESSKALRAKSTEAFISDAKRVHGDKYDYTETVYDLVRTPVEIRCPTHGVFSQVAAVHLGGSGCPRCATVISKPHQTVIDWLDEAGIAYSVNDRTVLKPKELDIYIPSHKLAIEVNGEYWHRYEALQDKHYHYDKFKACEAAGIHLMQFWAQTDVEEKPDIVKSMIMNALSLTTQKIPARKTKVVELSSKQYRDFMKTNHLEGAKVSKLKYGLEFDGRIVSALGFSSKGERGWELDRFASELGTSVLGGFSKLMKVRPPGKLVSYSYNRYSLGTIYKDYGFTLERENKTTLFYWQGGKLWNRNHFMRYKCAEKLGISADDKRSERELALELGAHQVFSGGTRTWVLHDTVI